LVVNHPELNFGEITRLLGREWAKCDSEQRLVFQKQANEINSGNTYLKQT